MSKRLQVIMPDDEYRAVAEIARRQGKPLSRIVRDSLRRTVAEEQQLAPEQRIAAVLRFARFAGPTGDIDQLLGEIERGRALGDREHLSAAYDALEAMISVVAAVTKDDVDQARAHSGRYPPLSSRDCLHLAVMQRIGCNSIWSYDTGFDAVGAIQRIA